MIHYPIQAADGQDSPSRKVTKSYCPLSPAFPILMSGWPPADPRRTVMLASDPPYGVASGMRVREGELISSNPIRHPFELGCAAIPAASGPLTRPSEQVPPEKPTIPKSALEDPAGPVGPVGPVAPVSPVGPGEPVDPA